MTGFNSKRKMAADKLQDDKCKYCVNGCIACDARAQKEALKLALEALEEAHYKIEHKQNAAKREQAITAIREALAPQEKNNGTR